MNHLPAVEKLRACTERHYNCAQSLLVPFADVCGITAEKAYDLGNMFGSGMHTGNICGTVTAAAMILGMAGFEKEVSVKMIRDFKDTHAGLLCRELLAESARKQIPRKLHCDALVFEMTRFLDETLDADHTSGE
jgi:hypothetical protein